VKEIKTNQAALNGINGLASSTNGQYDPKSGMFSQMDGRVADGTSGGKVDPTKADGYIDKDELQLWVNMLPDSDPKKAQYQKMLNNMDKYSAAHTDLPGGTNQSASNEIKGKLSPSDITTIQSWLATGMSWDEINKKLGVA
jgi:hypothetical protein